MKNYDWIQGFLLDKSEIFDFENDKEVRLANFFYADDIARQITSFDIRR